jgi:hypothetical protein
MQETDMKQINNMEMVDDRAKKVRLLSRSGQKETGAMA